MVLGIDHQCEEKKNTANKKSKKGEKKEGRTGHLSQFGVVNEVRSVSVDEGAQSQAILPTEEEEEKEKRDQMNESGRNARVGRFMRQKEDWHGKRGIEGR